MAQKKNTKKRYLHIGYFNEVGDVRDLAGKKADEVIRYWKSGAGRFHEEDSGNYFTEKEKKQNSGTMSVTSDGRYLVVDGSLDYENWLAEFRDSEDGDDACAYIDIYVLEETRTLYELKFWPESQEYFRKRGVYHVSSANDTYEQAVLVPVKVRSNDPAYGLYEAICWPDCQKYQNWKGVLQADSDEMLCFVPVRLIMFEERRHVIEKEVDEKLDALVPMDAARVLKTMDGKVAERLARGLADEMQDNAVRVINFIKLDDYCAPAIERGETLDIVKLADNGEIFLTYSDENCNESIIEMKHIPSSSALEVYEYALDIFEKIDNEEILVNDEGETYIENEI